MSIHDSLVDELGMAWAWRETMLLLERTARKRYIGTPRWRVLRRHRALREYRATYVDTGLAIIRYNALWVKLNDALWEETK